MYHKGVIWLLCALLLLTGCSQPFERAHQLELTPVGLPERVYTAPETRYRKNLRVGILPFDTPMENAQLSLKAAQYLSQALLENEVFTQIEVALDQPPPSRNRWRQLARDREYDLILLGTIDNLMEGSPYQATRLEITLQAIEIARSKEITRWYATAVEIITPRKGFDAVFFRARPAPAPDMDIVMRRNLMKFANLFRKAEGAHELQ